MQTPSFFNQQVFLFIVPYIYLQGKGMFVYRFIILRFKLMKSNMLKRLFES